jgi:hypothetical protein
MQLYFLIITVCILYFNVQIYCTVLQQLSSHAYVIKSRYNFYKQKILTKCKT